MEVVLPKETGKNLSLVELVHYYHGVKPKLKYKDICRIINNHHGVALSGRKLKYICALENLNRKRNVTPSILKGIIANELGTSSSQFGYKQMTENISLKYGVNVAKEVVRKLLLETDPEGVDSRRKKAIRRRIYESDGPGDVYHIDGHDKLKR